MNGENSIIKNKSLWELPSVAMIVATIGAGCNTTELIIKKGKSKQSIIELKDIDKEEIQGFISQGTYNKYRNILEEEKMIIVTNKKEVNRRKGKGYQFELNYTKFCEQIEIIFKKEVEEKVQRLCFAKVFFKERIELIEKRLKFYEAELKRIKAKSTPKKTYNILKEEFIDMPHNLPEIKDCEEKIKKMKLSISNYEHLISSVISFRKENDELLKKKWFFSDWETKEIRHILNTYFFWKLVFNDNLFTLNNMIKEFIEEVKRGELRNIGFELSNRFRQGVDASVYQEISKKELPNLFNIFKYFKQLDEFRGII
jgi:hypothetical protein